ncbi:MAG: hypothetical protein AAF899_19120 [Pseudomonadota bacterium]
MTEALTLNDQEIRGSKSANAAGADPMDLKRGTIEPSEEGAAFDDSESLIFVEESGDGVATAPDALSMEGDWSEAHYAVGLFKPIGKFVGRTNVSDDPIDYMTYPAGGSPDEIAVLWALWALE